MSAVKAPRATEAACQSAIIQAATTAGWLCHAERAAMTGGRYMTPIQGHAGFVDLVLVRGRECLLVELKRKPYKVTAEQTVWHEALRRARLTCFTIWVPEELDTFIAYLVSREGGQRPPLEVTG